MGNKPSEIRNIVSDFIEEYDPYRSPAPVVEEFVKKLEALVDEKPTTADASSALDLDRLEIVLLEELATWRSFLDWKNTGKPTDREVQYVLTYKPEEEVAALIAEVKRLRGEVKNLKEEVNTWADRDWHIDEVPYPEVE
jgi:predicted lactoylglutathione lyase